jgi:DNA polymerase-3 subunit epsilon
MLVYLDTETTGLDPTRHEIWEIAHAVDDGPIHTAIVPHTFTHPDPTALTLNGYLNRALTTPPDRFYDGNLEATLHGATLVAANPAFDAAFLRARWGRAPWHHRLLDIEAYAAGVLNLDTPPGLATITILLRAQGFKIPEPDHTAAGDVATPRTCHQALRQIAARQTR